MEKVNQRYVCRRHQPLKVFGIWWRFRKLKSENLRDLTLLNIRSETNFIENFSIVSAQGYAVSDSCAAFFIQRARDARRNWATVIGADFRFFGDKSDGNFISFHEEPVKKMLRENYEKWKIDPTTVTYIEADGCGFKVSVNVNQSAKRSRAVSAWVTAHC